MSLLDVLVLLMVAGICGAIGQAISGFSRGGLLASIALGFIGALLGMWLARLMNLPEPFTLDLGSVQFPIVWSIIGASLFVAVIALISRRPRDGLARYGLFGRAFVLLACLFGWHESCN